MKMLKNVAVADVALLFVGIISPPPKKKTNVIITGEVPGNRT
jgi:hypothetical protein